MTVIAVQGEIEAWQEQQSDNYYKHSGIHSSSSQLDTYQALTQQIKAIQVKEGFSRLDKQSQQRLEVLADELDRDFHSANPWEIYVHQTEAERINAFSSYCLNFIASKEVPDDKKKAILSLLNMRLQGHN